MGWRFLVARINCCINVYWCYVRAIDVSHNGDAGGICVSTVMIVTSQTLILSVCENCEDRLSRLKRSAWHDKCI